jgi:hypothetical protein
VAAPGGEGDPGPGEQAAAPGTAYSALSLFVRANREADIAAEGAGNTLQYLCLAVFILRTFLPVAISSARHGAPCPAIGDMPGAFLCAVLLWLICLFKPGYFSKVGQGPPGKLPPGGRIDP